MRKHAFTLIELLIVVAIIAILAAIAVPNFLEAQTRAKIARVLSDCRTVAVAVQAYRTDWNQYPIPKVYYIAPRPPSWNIYTTSVFGTVELSTPVAYLSQTRYIDPFKPDPGAAGLGNWAFTYPEMKANFLGYQNYGDWWGNQMPPYALAFGGYPAWPSPNPYTGFIVFSYGPDFSYSSSPCHVLGHIDRRNATEYPNWTDAIYDPSNGTVSKGDIGYAFCDNSPRRPGGMFGGAR